MIKNKNLNITNNNFMTTHKINKLSKNIFGTIKSTLEEEYNSKYRFSSIFSDKNNKYQVDKSKKKIYSGRSNVYFNAIK